MIYSSPIIKTRHYVGHVPYSLESYVLSNLDCELDDVLDTNNLAFNIYM